MNDFLSISPGRSSYARTAVEERIFPLYGIYHLYDLKSDRHWSRLVALSSGVLLPSILPLTKLCSVQHSSEGTTRITRIERTKKWTILRLPLLPFLHFMPRKCGFSDGPPCQRITRDREGAAVGRVLEIVRPLDASFTHISHLSERMRRAAMAEPPDVDAWDLSNALSPFHNGVPSRGRPIGRSGEPECGCRLVAMEAATAPLGGVCDAFQSRAAGL